MRNVLIRLSQWNLLKFWISLEHLGCKTHTCLSRVSSFSISIPHFISVLFHHSFCLMLKAEFGFAFQGCCNTTVGLITRQAAKTNFLEKGRADSFNQQWGCRSHLTVYFLYLLCFFFSAVCLSCYFFHHRLGIVSLCTCWREIKWPHTESQKVWMMGSSTHISG